MGNDAVWEDSLDNSAEIIWHCNPLLCKMGPSTAKAAVLWSALRNTLSQITPLISHLDPYFSHFHVVMFLFCVLLLLFFFLTEMIVIFLKRCSFPWNPLWVFSPSLCREPSTKLVTLHEVSVWKIRIAHNNQHAFRQDCVTVQRRQMGQDGVSKEAVLYFETMMVELL